MQQETSRVGTDADGRTYVRFKSSPENFDKEYLGKKPNTVREPSWHDYKDQRWPLLQERAQRPGLDGEVTRIVIDCIDDERSFARTITDVTEWKGLFIISWEHPRGKEE